MHLRQTVSLTPDKSVKWERSKLGNGTLYLAKGAPSHSTSLLQSRLFEIGPEVGSGEHGTVHETWDGVYAVKEFIRDPLKTRDAWYRFCGFEALALNVCLQEGLSRLGEKAHLSNGVRVTTPVYFGAFIEPDKVQVLMSHERGQRPETAPKTFIGTPDERRRLYDAALSTVGESPDRLEGYDDAADNLLVRWRPIRELVKLDASNHQSESPA
jgi:hypothetical protein